jgi:hypothetical protein
MTRGWLLQDWMVHIYIYIYIYIYGGEESHIAAKLMG